MNIYLTIHNGICTGYTITAGELDTDNVIRLDEDQNPEWYLQRPYNAATGEWGERADRSLSVAADALQAAQIRLSSMAIVAAQPKAMDAVIAEMIPIKKAIAEPWQPGKEYIPPYPLEYEGIYYVVIHQHNSQAHQTPGSEGTLTIYRPFDAEQHAGTLDDPIPWIGGMDCYQGNYYSYGGKVYLLTMGDLIPCLGNWCPGAFGVHHWQLVSS